MVHRELRKEVVRLLRRYPVVALVGARQVGKTTLAQDVARTWRGDVDTFDLENVDDVARLTDPMLALAPLRGLVVIDEVQRRPDLFPTLRVLADRRPPPARFLVLGSASRDLLRQSSETLAGRIAYRTMSGFSIGEVGVRHAERLWVRGGFPRSYLARSDKDSAEWRRELVRTFLERDVPLLGIPFPPETLHRLWAMLAHHHGGILHVAELARSFAVSDHTARRYVDALVATFMIRLLPPWHENIGKRQVKAPKVYFADSGILHNLLKTTTLRELRTHPKVGASWEGFALGEIIRTLGAEPDECFFWATHQGAELDLLVVRGRRRLGFEVKLTTAPVVTRSMRSALADLRLDGIDVVHAGEKTFKLDKQIRAVAFRRLAEDIPRTNTAT